MLAGVLPTPAVALLALDLGVVITASHNPPEYNGVKFFDGDGHKLTDARRRRSRRCSTLPSRGGGTIDRVEVATDSYFEHVVERFGSDLDRPANRRRLRERRLLGDRARGVRAHSAPR